MPLFEGLLCLEDISIVEHLPSPPLRNTQMESVCASSYRASNSTSSWCSPTIASSLHEGYRWFTFAGKSLLDVELALDHLFLANKLVLLMFPPS